MDDDDVVGDGFVCGGGGEGRRRVAMYFSARQAEPVASVSMAILSWTFLH